MKSLNILLRGAAVRILVTRLHDKIFQPEDALVIPKDPKEYLKILEWHQKHNIIDL
jgi:homoserine kinase type II